MSIAAEADRIGLVSQVVAADELLASLLRTGRPHHRLEPGRDRADQASALEQPGRVEPADAHGCRRDGAALRPHHHPELRGVGGRARNEGRRPTSGLMRRTDSGCVDQGVGRHDRGSRAALRHRRLDQAVLLQIDHGHGAGMWRSQASRSGGPMTNGTWRMRSRG